MLAHARRLSALTQPLHAASAQHFLPTASHRLFASVQGLEARRTLHSSSGSTLSNTAARTGRSPLVSPVVFLQVRAFSRRGGRHPWESGQGDWLSTVKTGALLALGAGAVVAAASVGFGFIVFGAAGYGVYTLYQRFFAPYRTNDPFGQIQADIDRIFKNDRRSRDRSATRTATGGKDLDSLVDGLPFVVRGLVKTLFSFVGGAMQNSMARAGELRRLANDAMRGNANIVSQMGSDVSISTPQNWMEYSVNGVGRVEAVFPVIGSGHGKAQITTKASIDANGDLALQELKYQNLRTGEVIDLMRSPGSRRKTVVDAEYVELDDRK